jgi:hypothetical protein
MNLKRILSIRFIVNEKEILLNINPFLYVHSIGNTFYFIEQFLAHLLGRKFSHFVFFLSVYSSPLLSHFTLLWNHLYDVCFTAVLVFN